jgi:phage-related protein
MRGLLKLGRSILIPMETFNFRYEADQTGTVAARSKSIQFGEGYTQRSPDALNQPLREYQLECSGLKLNEVLLLDAFLDRHGGSKAFLFMPNGLPQGKFVIIQPIQLSQKRAGGDIDYFYTRSFKIRQVYDL